MRTRDEILAYAAEHGLRHLPFPELELDATSGGYAFENPEGHIVVLGYDGSWAGHLLTPQHPTPESVVRNWLVASRHRNRTLVLK
ncbi:MAG TPA: hypothetical protein VLI04_16930, partial [Nocardioidaceae bacterium]|nr:hypothetical protein [Nocardioidaceae bacterium]